MPAPAPNASRIANSSAPTADQARKALSTLEAWALLGCPGGPWKALEPLSVLREHLDAVCSRHSSPEIAAPAADAACAGASSTP